MSDDIVIRTSTGFITRSTQEESHMNPEKPETTEPISDEPKKPVPPHVDPEKPVPDYEDHPIVPKGPEPKPIEEQPVKPTRKRPPGV